MKKSLKIKRKIKRGLFGVMQLMDSKYLLASTIFAAVAGLLIYVSYHLCEAINGVGNSIC